ncbi:MAG: serine/threonine-protein kinase [Byssovorax sp.]
MNPAAPDDDALEGLIGAVVPSAVVAGVGYRIVWRIGEGAMSVVFYAIRITPQGESPVVVKVLRPSFVQRAGPTAALIIKKESIALGRLNERVPPTPFVIRFIDTGTFGVTIGERRVELPWVVVEYVHGGAEGTTLSERVEHSLRATGSGFDPSRAAHAVECLASGLVAVHEVGVIHRDLKPDNVLCCGFGAEEIFKIADFGVARPTGIATFSGAIVGTPGFVAPELTAGDSKAIGPWSDIFSLAAVIFYMLTGEEYFIAKNPAEAIMQAVSPRRRSIRDTAGLSPELRGNAEACRAIDFALGCGSSAKIDARPHRADALAAMLTPWLRVEAPRPSLMARRLDQIREDDDPTQIQRWTWTTLRNAVQGMVVRSVAWDADGRAMAATGHGIAFWNGDAWRDVSLEGFPSPGGVRFVQRVGAGEWLIGGDNATFATVGANGVTGVRMLQPGNITRFDRISGDFDDLAILVGSGSSGPPHLCARTGKRWLKPFPLPDVAVVTSLARVEDAKWIVAGRLTEGEGFAAVYSPLDAEIERLPGASVRAFLSCAGLWDRSTAMATGADGAVIWRQGLLVTNEIVSGGHDLSASGIDAVGRGWAASAGKIWLRRTVTISARALTTARWDCVWDEPRWTMPIVSLFADLGVVIGMTAEGGVIEGRVLNVTLIDDGDVADAPESLVRR